MVLVGSRNPEAANSALEVSATGHLIWDKIQLVGLFPQVKKSRQICLPWRPLPTTFAPTVPPALQMRSYRPPQRLTSAWRWVLGWVAILLSMQVRWQLANDLPQTAQCMPSS